MSDRVVVYTDGAYSVDPDIGGWAYLIIHGDSVIKSSGGKAARSTSNAMELKALCEAMAACKNMGISEVMVYSDSAYLVNYFGEIGEWSKNDWKKKNGSAIKNRSLWKRIYDMTKKGMNVNLEKVKAHSGDKYNETVDSLAKGAIDDVRSRKDC